MGAPEDFVRYFESRKGVLKVMELSDGQFRDLWSEELRVKTQTHSDYENVGFEILSKRKTRICIFVNDDFVFNKHSLLRMLDGDGKIIGTTVPEEEMDAYRDRTDVVWLSKDFVMFLEVEAHGKERFVLYPYEFPELSDEIPGCLDVMGTSPAPTTDAMLKEMGGMPLNTRLYTFVLGFDSR